MKTKKRVFLRLVLAVVAGVLLRHGVGRYFPLDPHPPSPVPDVARLYERSAQYDGPTRNPVIVIPGFLGSKLVDRATGRVVWGAFTSESVDPAVDADARLIAVPISGASADSAASQNVAASGVLDSITVSISGIKTVHHAYLNILSMLGVGGYRDEELGLSGAINYGNQHYTCFQFPYDWRKDNAENAKALHDFLLQKKAYIEAERTRAFGKSEPVKFDIVAHSMGGLIARYYLRYGSQQLNAESPPELNWSGAELVDRVIMIGTPNGGSAKTLLSVTEGVQFAPLLPRYPGAILATMPAVYQMMPRLRHGKIIDSKTGDAIDPLELKTWETRGWGLLASDAKTVLAQLLPEVPAEKRLAIARQHVSDCLQKARLFQAALDVDARPPDGVEIHLFAGDAIPTPSRVTSDSSTGKIEVTEAAPGDRTVTRQSAVADERNFSTWTPHLRSPVHFETIRFLFSDHFGLTRDPAFVDNALFLLLEKRRGNESDTANDTEFVPVDQRGTEGSKTQMMQKSQMMKKNLQQ